MESSTSIYGWVGFVGLGFSEVVYSRGAYVVTIGENKFIFCKIISKL